MVAETGPDAVESLEARDMGRRPGPRVHPFVLTPPMLFAGVWAGVITLYQLAPFRMFTVPVTTTSLALHLAGVMVFCGAAAAVNAEYRRAMDGRPAPGAPTPTVQWLVLPTVAVLLLFGALVAMKFGLVVHHYGNPFTALHTIRDDTTRGAFGFPLVGHLTSPLAGLAVLNVGILIADQDTPTALPLALATFGLIFLNDITFADQEGMRLALLCLCAVYYGVTVWRGVKLRPVRFLRTAAAFVVGIILVVSVSVFRSVPHYQAEGERQASRTRQLLVDAVAVHLYGDIVGNYVSSSWFLAHPLPSDRFGANTLSGFYTFKQLIVRPPIRTGDPDWRYYAPIMELGTFNTTDYLAVFASDFGIVGALVLSAALGGGAMWVFLRAIRCRRIEDVQILALVTVGVVTAVRGNYFGAVGFWIIVALVLLQARTIPRRSTAPRTRRIETHRAGASYAVVVAIGIALLVMLLLGPPNGLPPKPADATPSAVAQAVKAFYAATGCYPQPTEVFGQPPSALVPYLHYAAMPSYLQYVTASRSNTWVTGRGASAYLVYLNYERGNRTANVYVIGSAGVDGPVPSRTPVKLC